jgi:hypothetical protein
LSTENSRNVTPNREMERALLDALVRAFFRFGGT